MSVERLFVYGTLKDATTQVEVFGRPLDGEADAIVGYRMSWITIDDAEIIRKSGTRSHPIVEKAESPEAVVEGVVLAVSQADLALADEYERGYVRVVVSLSAGGSAFLYRPLTEAT